MCLRFLTSSTVPTASAVAGVAEAEIEFGPLGWVGWAGEQAPGVLESWLW